MSASDDTPIEVIDDEMAAVLARKSGAERLLIAARMFRSARSQSLLARAAGQS